MKIFKNVELKRLTYYKTGGFCPDLFYPEHLSDLVGLLDFFREKNQPFFFLGEGSNTLISDETLDASVICLKYFRYRQETSRGVFFSAGFSNSELANFAYAHHCQSYSWIYALPGLLGASLRVNARCFGSEMSQVTSQVLCLDESLSLKIYESSDFFYGYKETLAMKENIILLGAWFHFQEKASRGSIQKAREEVVLKRLQRHHFQFPSCGSVFKNDPQNGAPTGQLVDSLGLKGLKKGKAQVSYHHGNFIWNLGQAQSHDIFHLMERVRGALLDEHYLADYEVEFKGSFRKEKEGHWRLPFLSKSQMKARDHLNRRFLQEEGLEGFWKFI